MTHPGFLFVNDVLTKIGYISRDGILGLEYDKQLDYFAPCYSQYLVLADFYRKPYSTLVLKLHTKNSAKQENSSSFMNDNL
jgi:hypothetical protein